MAVTTKTTVAGGKGKQMAKASKPAKPATKASKAKASKAKPSDGPEVARVGMKPGEYCWHRVSDLPWSAKKLAVLEALAGPCKGEASTAEIAAAKGKVAVSQRDARHYGYAAVAGGLVKYDESTRRFTITAKGKASLAEGRKAVAGK